MNILSGLNPAPVWTFFEEICRIPRLSKNEGKIRKYLLDLALKHKLDSKEDSIGNVLITRSASPGFENRKTLVLQGHMDMVGEKETDHPHNWETDPVVPYIDNGWVTARGTTLGADDGIGIASQLAILTDTNLKAGKIECLFTVDEESGMTGAMNLKSDFFDGRTLVNLDSEDEGIVFIGCAGGMDTIINLKYTGIPLPAEYTALEVSITGLHGGHSGDEIHKGYGNAVKLMTRLLTNLSDKFDISISVFNGGNLRNAIPREAFSTIAVSNNLSDKVISFITGFRDMINEEFGELEKGISVSVKKVETPSEIMNKKSQSDLLKSLSRCPHGVLAWSKEMDDLVETSTNLASVNFTGMNSVRIVTTQRSSVESSKLDASVMVQLCFKQDHAEVTCSTGYPGWRPDLKSEVLKITVNSYNCLFGKEPEIRAIHAGLECGLFYQKIEGIDMISFGPTIRGAHTPGEKIEIQTVQMFWDLLTDVIKNIPVKTS